ncbi:clavesin-1-like [Anopheles ziemanni]|uniref:clavesin-1-like n=1 Tax=Anopheles coustani TaxID=139045 RepID=UPI002657FC66|nr:clavesin-1-like [Anopheles coustani]XP_058178532.1 clavesin-1-like [Anopheles ziemanni]
MSNRVEYSFDKNRKVEESYKFTLPELYRKIAQEELREDDVVREQALTQMREWIVSNPHIRKCRVDAPFLLRFLRFRKFSVPLACEALEQYLTVREMYPSWFKKLDASDPEMRRIQESGGVYVLGQDSAGRTVLLMEIVQLEKERFMPLPEGRFLFLLLEALLEFEEVQIGGIQLLVDYTGISMDLFEGWGATELKIGLDAFTRFTPVRYHEIHAAKLPKVAVSFVEYMLTFAPSKFRELIHCHATVDKLKEQLDPSMTPQIYGGTVDAHELTKKFWERFELQNENYALGLDKFDIDLDHYTSVWSKQNPDMAEAKEFKKLSID